jgi:hypothetical protein
MAWERLTRTLVPENRRTVDAIYDHSMNDHPATSQIPNDDPAMRQKHRKYGRFYWS